MMKTLALLAVLALGGCTDDLVNEALDTPEEHRARLACEMRQMDAHMAAENAVAYCDKEMEMTTWERRIN